MKKQEPSTSSLIVQIMSTTKVYRTNYLKVLAEAHIYIDTADWYGWFLCNYK